MTWLVLKNWCTRYDVIKVVFANTGQERAETLEFIKRCDEHFVFNTVWIEAVVNPERNKGVRHRVVDFVSAARGGEPFEAAIKKYGIPNAAFKSCTRILKRDPIESYARSLGWGKDYDVAIGIRADEIDRMSVAAVARRIIYPLVRDFPTDKKMINKWWVRQPFRLKLRSYQGNCAWCWKKSLRKHLTLISETPEIYDFPRRMEQQYGHIGPEFAKEDRPGYRRTFFRNNNSTEDLFAEYARRAGNFVPAGDDAVRYDTFFDVGGGCEESCEVFADEDEVKL